MSQFFAFLSRMKFINRWSLMRNTFSDNLAEHSYQTAVLAHALAIIENTLYDGKVDEGKVVTIALYHDTPELLTGDMPTPVKYYNVGLREAYQNVENYAEQRLLSLLPENLMEKYRDKICADKTSREYRLVKFADKLCAYIKTIEELSCGNYEFEKANKTIEAELSSYNDETLKYFMKNFIEAFRCTLDEIDL